MNWSWFIINTLLSLQAYGIDYKRSPTQIPVYIQVFNSGGFQASIKPSTLPSAIVGLQLFAFHGNINAPIRLLESGQYSGTATKPDRNGYWTQRHDSVKLNINDVINYWAYIQVNNTGYKLDCRSYMVFAEGKVCVCFSPELVAIWPQHPIQGKLN